MTTDHHIGILAFLIIFLIVIPALPAHAETRGFRGAMIRRTGTTNTINFTQAVQRSHRRLAFLASRSRVNLPSSASHLKNNQTDTVPLSMDDSAGEYNMEFSIGTPPQKLTAIADTGSDLIWAKCGAACATSCTPQDTPSYNPGASSTFTKLPCSGSLCTTLFNNSQQQCAAGDDCSYTYYYGFGVGAVYTQGYLGTETFTLGGDAAPGVGFGCTTASDGFDGSGSGIVGLGRGPLSLVSQLDAGTFMYCLTSDAAKSSPLLFGSLATLKGAHIQSTGLLPSTTYYAVSLLGMSIGSTKTAGIVGGSDGGVVFDSGTTLTYLADPAYTEAKEAFMSQISSRFIQTDAGGNDGFEACYEKPSNGNLTGVPAMVLHFAGGADMELPVPNYFVEVYHGIGILCWIVQKTPNPSLSIIGNIMQKNYLVLHDVRKSVLSFQPANCDSYKQKNEASGSRSPPPFLYQFFTMILCFSIYMYTSIF